MRRLCLTDSDDLDNFDIAIDEGDIMHYRKALDDALAATMIGSNVMMSFYGKEYETKYKREDGIDVHEMIYTEADEKTQKAVIDYLKRRYWPEVGIFAEEGQWRSDPSRFNTPFHWQIDPIDGTMGFKNKTDNFGISIALVSREGRAVVGVVHNPAQNLLAYACVNETSILNSSPIVASDSSEDDKLKIIVSANKAKNPRMKRALDLFPNKEILSADSTVTKALRVFAAEADLFFAVPGLKVHSWDLAAIAVIAEQSACNLTDFKGRRIALNNKDDLWPHGFILSNGKVHDYALGRLATWHDG